MSQNWALHLVVMVSSEWWMAIMNVVSALIIAVFTSTVECGYSTPSQNLELPKLQPATNGFNQYSAQYSPPHVSAAGVALTIPGRTAPYTLVQGNRQYVNQYRAQQNYYAHKNRVNLQSFRAPHNYFNQYHVNSQQIVDPADIYSEQDSLPLPPATGVQPPNLRPPPSQTSQVPIVSKPVEIEHYSGYLSPQSFPHSFLPEISHLSLVQHQQEPAFLQSQRIPPPVYFGFQPIQQTQSLANQQVFNSQTLTSQQSHPQLLTNTESSSPEQSVSYTISNADKQFLHQYDNSQYHSQNSEENKISGLDNVHGVQVTNFAGNPINHDATFSQQYANDAVLHQNNQQSTDLFNNYNNIQIPTSPPYDSGFVNTRPAADAVVMKHIYVHLPPSDAEETPVALPSPQKKTYNIIFLKVPSYESHNSERILKQLQTQQTVDDKTLIYVLVKKPEVEYVPTTQVLEPSKPEVFFVNYKGNPITEEEESQSLE